MYRFILKVYGCQMNVYDGDKLRTALIRNGWQETPENEADIVIFNGCSIRAKAEHKVWSELGRYGESWSDKKKPFVAVTGCIAQRLGSAMMTRFPWVRLVGGPRHIGDLPEALERVMAGERVSLLDEDPRAFVDLAVPPIERVNLWKAYVTIAHGCDNFCTYCIVPYVRGRFVSRLPEDILVEIRGLVEDGVKEITLLGQNVNSYGQDFKNGYTFSSLLRDVAAIDGLPLLRFVTSHPKDFTPDIVEVMAHYPKICPSINLPIQSGSDRILKKMNRKYTLAKYRETVSVIRNALPEVGLTSDLIVGFPGETEEDFQASVAALHEFRYDLVHTAAYSPREGTAAATMEDQIDQDVKMKRLNTVNAVQSEIALQINRGLVGKRYKILIDDWAPKGESLVQGRTPGDKVVIMEGTEEFIGRFALVSITSAENWCLHGEVISIID
ncbi:MULTISPECIES: tRNA (N6-isopentenyl adenosine(37)-C2)-methylthiotransferase MiaB [Aminobacterium]|uniref:tRNA (N6-isopentenyl adenosine(37)-C2)-methylthiotransferase MiaB n=1 Tax=Aminobacterium TaxID=81466 RepID=UPI0016AB5AAE|nr:tRNA (N6-isopentenyl adenosine(37)-C2)-methylthiotransferase MiaB [Aminobacterium sp. EBM-42]MDD2378904.1 tRNA (N6-isopentenyl adenosine(37)-C2)-methylthiotransferase MiaB [Aminobacterium colombiense]MDD3767701.1 tRNA (N6-isopentenyl adenosine(37)-C2)-methylthiotransferase MiaB [Aminobacterium colombiense]MDD4265103.1 tRNA (N6-isopentenyl adenosine(37)-C2)-methylthiotransferase MiaB [Aminobacterium colombiense]MDD4585716.1 tRNA (N6-isopentenyl adenosine(37)-C2)-methylthiotransferase MiaB [Am